MMFALRNMTFDKVNLLMNDMVSGMPSPLAFLGLASAIAPKVGCSRWSVRVLPIIHSVTESAGRTKPELEVKDGAFSPVEMLEDMIGTVRVSMILDLPGCENIGHLEEALTGIRFCGGTLRNRMAIKPKEVSPDGRALHHVPRGFAVLPHEDAPLHQVTSGVDRIEALFDAIQPAAGKSGWRIPVAAGYRLLEDPQDPPERTGTRNDTIPHVFAEPLTSLGELVSVKNRARMTELDEASFRAKFWSWTCEGDLVLGHKAFLANEI